MKSPLGKLRSALNKSEPKEIWDHGVSLHTDGLNQAAKDMKDMRACYDSLLSAAAATTNSAYEFSESLLEMGNCLLEKTATHEGGETGGALSLLGKVQLDLQKLVDIYRSHIVMTITYPSESLLSELRKVEEMKLQCDEKREMFEYMVGQLREKGKSRHGKGDTFSSQQLNAVREEYDEVARLCVFRVESLKQGQCRSLLTQAARHHAAQLNFFRKGLQSLEAVEPHIKDVAVEQHIDYALNELNDGGEGDYEGNSYATIDEGELSFDYRRNTDLENSRISSNLMEVDQLGASSTQISRTKDAPIHVNFGKNQAEQTPNQQRRVGSYSAPLYAEKKFDPAERIREMQTAVHKLHTHVLPTPADARGSTSSSTSLTSTATPVGGSKNMWHSSPLDTEKQKKIMDDHISAQNISKTQATVEENSNIKHSLPLPRPLTEGAPTRQFESQSGSDTRRIKRQAFSGPIASKPSSSKPLLPTSGPISSTEAPQTTSGLLSRVPNSQPLSSLNVAHNSSPPILSSPKISELHELPRPPDSVNSQPMRSLGNLGYSAPLSNRNREVSPTNRNPFKSSREGSPLPLPQLTVSRSFSIPSSSQRATAFNSGKLLESSQTVHKAEEVASPPLTPISLLNMKSPNSRQIRGGG